MWRHVFRSLRIRMAILVAAVVAVTAAAAIATVWTFTIADDHVKELAAAQRRLEHLSAISSRVGDYALIALQTTQSHANQSDELSLPRKRVQEAFKRLDDEIGHEVSRQSDESAAALINARSRVVAYMRARFDFLDRQTMQAIKDARGGAEGGDVRVKVAMDLFASSFGPSLGQAIEEERAASRRAEAAMSDLRAKLIPNAVVAVGLAALIAALLYRTVASPLLARLSEVASAASDIARGRTDIRLSVRGHDELSLLMMRFNRMAAQLSRRESRLMSAQLRLQETVDARTAELRSANERLSEIDRARRRFFTDVSHELRTPLTVILGEADVTLRAADPPASDLKTALGTIRSRARRLHRRVEDLLRVARSESGQLELEFKPVSVADIVEQAREGIAPQALAAGLTLLSARDSSEPVIEADADWLRQVIEGLIANAVRHSSNGGSIRLDVRREADGGALVSVADDGEGIPDADLPHVFERFYRGVGRSERSGSGFGIGLALARWVVERHGGTIAIESRASAPGRRSGTTVTIRLPALAPRLAFGAAS
ncbi:ATP-binding protein [Hansschlegelia sp. KR7-227]|uniref:sensor histidine kinase n=1 Tax=Hansschlegelia sp. KR7-227 TaxID=3400914 RepID=UPI003BFEAF17